VLYRDKYQEGFDMWSEGAKEMYEAADELR
jgi:hypothetical protein